MWRIVMFSDLDFSGNANPTLVFLLGFGIVSTWYRRALLRNNLGFKIGFLAHVVLVSHPSLPLPLSLSFSVVLSFTIFNCDASNKR